MMRKRLGFSRRIRNPTSAEKKMELSRYEIVDVEVVSPPKVEKVHWDYVLKEVVGESS